MKAAAAKPAAKPQQKAPRIVQREVLLNQVWNEGRRRFEIDLTAMGKPDGLILCSSRAPGQVAKVTSL
jgi:hypothetical protein